ncbi:MAG: tetratricopeptide repeat protein [Helicobacteraceae bacterium]|nr:tetratricopeptide repeat protein [Helicobacteraceae bacterium]
MDPNDANAYHNRGYAYDHLRDCDKAIADLTQALEIDPNRSRVYHFRSEAYCKLGDLQNARIRRPLSFGHGRIKAICAIKRALTSAAFRSRVLRQPPYTGLLQTYSFNRPLIFLSVTVIAYATRRFAQVSALLTLLTFFSAIS